ncbi:LysR substrate-binding domain-containing protein [Pseudomonas putida]|uniref:LysR family transcriptional regulator n=1 Tax=Pseudomonas putida TaxID=303 RepID=UPI00335B2B7E
MRSIELEDLHIFRSVVREGGIAKAAKHLDRAPSNVTTRVKQLEERLGIGLFRRQGRNLVLTEPGLTLLKHAEKLLQMADLAEEEMRTGCAGGVLKLGSLESIAGGRLPPFLSAFHLEHPDITIELQTGYSDVLIKKLERNEIDAAFVAEPFDKGSFHSALVFQDQLKLISAKGKTQIRSAQDLQGQTIVVFPHGCVYRQRMIEWLTAEGVSPGKILEFGSYHTIVACVAGGMGVGIISQALLDHAVMGNSLQQHPLPQEFSGMRVHLVWPAQETKQLKAFRALLPKISLRSQSPGTDRFSMDFSIQEETAIQ